MDVLGALRRWLANENMVSLICWVWALDCVLAAIAGLTLLSSPVPGAALAVLCLLMAGGLVAVERRHRRRRGASDG
mgnify:CR=1 FL=1